MLQKSFARKKSAARKSKSFPKGMAASWSTDDVYNLLKAVNEQTLKRMEDLIKAINEVTLSRMEKQVKDVNEVTLARMEKQVKDVNEITLKRMEDLIKAIKTKTDRLP